MLSRTVHPLDPLGVGRAVAVRTSGDRVALHLEFDSTPGARFELRLEPGRAQELAQTLAESLTAELAKVG
jgi:hypothetical protein